MTEKKKFRDCGSSTFPYMVVEKDGMRTWHMSLNDARDYAKLSKGSKVMQRKETAEGVVYQQQ